MQGRWSVPGLERIFCATGEIRLPRLNAQTKSAALFDAQGKAVWESDISSGIPLSPPHALARGVYLLRQFR